MNRFTLLNTRPAKQAAALSQLVSKNGGDCLHCPTLQIELNPQAWHSLAEETLFDALIFTSVNAIEGFFEQDAAFVNRISANAKVYAIGKATAQAGAEHGLQIEVLSNQRFDSESLLAHDTMQQVNKQRFLLVKGENGRELIANTLRDRGAMVTPFIVYRRVASAFCNQEWQRFLHSEHAVLLVTSLESWQALMQGVQKWLEDATSLSGVPVFKQSFWQQIELLVVMSERIAEAIKQQGCPVPISVVQTQSNEGIVEAIIMSQNT